MMKSFAKHFRVLRVARLAATLLAYCLGNMPAVAAGIRTVHVFVALADNQHQGIVPVPARLGNGQDAAANLYWGAAYGVKSYFKSSADWKLISCQPAPRAPILERCIFHQPSSETYLVADAYDGARIRDAIVDFLSSSAGVREESVCVGSATNKSISIAGKADLVVYVGHDALMDFQVPKITGNPGSSPRKFIILACASRPYFRSYMQSTGSEPLLWTTGLMAPEAYSLKAALEGWIAGENAQLIQERAARAYDKYQKCGLRAAQRLFVSTW